MKKIILASQSPRRRELLKLIDVDFDVLPSDCDECTHETEPGPMVLELSKQKALDVVNKTREEDAFIVGSDTIVVYNGKILGKPKTEKEAFEMLKSLSGNTHQVYTGVTIVDKKSGAVKSFYEVTDVCMYQVSDEEIHGYIATGDPFDKAGGYGVQSKGAFLVKEIKGDFYTVVGLPVARLYRELIKLQF